MSPHEENQTAPNACSGNGAGHTYGPCACCVALAQVRFPHYHHDTGGAPYQYPYAAGYALPPPSTTGSSCSTCGGGNGGPGNDAGKDLIAATSGTELSRNVNGAGSGLETLKNVFPMSNFLSSFVKITPKSQKLSKTNSRAKASGGKAHVTRDGGARESEDASALPTAPAAGKSESNQDNNSVEGEADISSTGNHDDVGDWSDEEPEIKIPKPRRIWHGLDGIAVCLFGILMPGGMFALSCLSMPKRVTLVLLNHPLETLLEMALILAIPLINYSIWSSICANKIKFTRLSSLSLGLATGTALIISTLCIAAMFASSNQSLLYAGADLGTGFSWLAIMSLVAAAVSAFIVSRLRATRDFASTKKQVVACSAIGALISLLLSFAAEARPWNIRIAEHMAVSGSKTEQKQGLAMLRQLNPERELRMECSDPRAAGLCGLFIPVKPSSEHELYFTLTGKPYSFREFNNTDLSSMPDDYLSRNVVGDLIEGLSLTRSTMTGYIHPKTMSATLNWTFVFKNDSAQPQEARAEIGLPPGAVITGLTAWTKGEAQDATFVASGKAQGVSNWTEVGHDSPAIVTDLGHGRVLMHCYPVPREEESKVSIKLVVPLNPDRSKSASLIMPKFIATNFGLTEGEFALRLRGSEKLSSGIKTLKVDRTPGGEYAIGGTLSDADLKSNKLLIDTQRSTSRDTIAVLDPLAWKMAKEEQKRLEEIAKEKARKAHAEQLHEQVVVMVDGSKGIDTQIDLVRKAFARRNHATTKKAAKPVTKPIPARYVVESVERVSAAAPKHLVVVVDGSATTKEYSEQIRTALGKLPAGINTSLIIASKESDKLGEPMPLSAGLAVLKNAPFIGGQDNLKAVVKAAELAGEITGSAVLWIHGPQPVLTQEIYIMSTYAAAPAFYEMSLGSGETDTYEFFKNHPEIGPFTAIPRNSNNVGNDMTAFFGRWMPDDSSYAIKLAMTTKKPVNPVTLTRDETIEVRTLHAAQRCAELVAAKRLRMAANIAVRYGFVSPVSSALISTNTPAVHEGENVDAFSNQIGSTDENNAEIPASNPSQGASENPPAQASSDTSSTESGAQTDGSAPQMQGATNGTIGPQAGDATVIQGVNTAGTVRVNNLANLEALLNIIANLSELGMVLVGIVTVIHGIARGDMISELMGQEIAITRGARISVGVAMIMFGLSVPGMINWFVASARDANLFS